MPGLTLEQLEDDSWPEPSYQSYLVTTIHRLRQKPICEFGVEDLRIVIRQGVGLSHLVPRAVELLEREPLAEGDYYPGDLIAAVIGQSDWLLDCPELAGRVAAVSRRVLTEPADIEPALRQSLVRFVDALR